jgi:hypothetical protein
MIRQRGHAAKRAGREPPTYPAQRRASKERNRSVQPPKPLRRTCTPAAARAGAAAWRARQLQEIAASIAAVPLAALMTFAVPPPRRSPSRASSTFTSSPRLVYQRFASIVSVYGSSRAARGKDAR